MATTTLLTTADPTHAFDNGYSTNIPLLILIFCMAMVIPGIMWLSENLRIKMQILLTSIMMIIGIVFVFLLLIDFDIRSHNQTDEAFREWAEHRYGVSVTERPGAGTTRIVDDQGQAIDVYQTGDHQLILTDTDGNQLDVLVD